MTDLSPAAQEQQWPTDREILAQAAVVIAPYDSCGIAPGEYEAETECAVEAYGSELVAFARAVLARWGGAAPQPVPVSERLPEDSDCIAHPRSKRGLWCWGLVRNTSSYGVLNVWRLMRQEDLVNEAVSWLPGWSMPLAEVERD